MGALQAPKLATDRLWLDVLVRNLFFCFEKMWNKLAFFPCGSFQLCTHMYAAQFDAALTPTSNASSHLASFCNSNATTSCIRFNWITLPLLSNARKVYTGILSCCSYFESITHYYWILQRLREAFKSQVLCNMHWKWNCSSYSITCKNGNTLTSLTHNLEECKSH